MRWLLTLVLFAAVTPTWADGLGALPIESSLVDCDADPAPTVRLTDSALVLAGLRAGQRYFVSILEHGVELGIATDAQEPVWIGSSPAGYAREFMFITADEAGTAEFLVKVAQRFAWNRLGMEMTCLTGANQNQHAGMRANVSVATQLASALDRGDQVAALRALGGLIGMLWRTDRPSQTRVWALFQLATLASWGGSRKTEYAWLRLAREEAIALDDPVRAAAALRSMGNALMESDRLHAAATYDRAIEEARSLGLEDLATSAANGKCILKRIEGENAAATACYVATIAAFAAINDVGSEASARNSRATALLYDGRYGEARNELDRAVLLAQRSDAPLLIARTSLVRAQMARWDGDFETALALLNGALQLYGQLGRTVEMQRAEQYIAQTYDLAQEPARAQHFLLSALGRARQRGDATSAADIELSLAALFAASADHERALILLRGANAVLAEHGSAGVFANGILQQATVELAANRPDLARITLKRLERVEPSLQWRYRMKVVALRLQLGVASPDFDAEHALWPAATEALGKGDLTLFLELSEALLADRERRGDQRGALELSRLAIDSGLRVASQLRSPLLRNALLTRLKQFAATPLWQLPDGPLDRAEVELALADLERLRAVEQEPMPSAPLDNALIELERVLADASRSDAVSSPQREELLLNLISSEAAGPLSDVHPRDFLFSLADWASTAAPTQALLYQVMLGERAGALTFDTRGWRWQGGLDAAALRQETRALQVLLQGGHGSRDELDTHLARLTAALRWDELFASAPARLSLIFDSELAPLPWGMLPAPGEPARDLLSTTELIILQSLRAHAALPFSRLQAVAAGAASAPGLPALAQTSAELALVSANWPRLAPVQYPTASREQLTAALQVPGALVHIAAHGRGDQGRSEDAGLWLADANGQPDFVSALRLRRMQVGAELIVLGACDTGAAASGRSLGMGGVAGSLVDAGAGAVVGTRWPVSDRVAHDFADAFHRALAKDPGAPASALRVALQELRRSPASRHPTHWAGWFLVRRGPTPAADGNS